MMLASPSAVGAAQEPEPFVVEGRVANGTADGAAPQGLMLRVLAFARDRVAGTWEAESEPGGGYRVEGVERVPGASYWIGADYEGATYLEQMEVPNGPTATRDLTVYDSVDVNPGIRFEQSAIVVSSVDEGKGLISLFEIHSVVNPTDRAFVPRPGGGGGPNTFLVFGLPPDAFDVIPQLGLDQSRIVQIDRGFASFSPLLPGRTEVAFQYRVPLAGSELRIGRTVRYPLSTMRALSPAEGPELRSETLAPGEAAEVAGRQYRSLAGGPFAEGASFDLTIAGIPGGPAPGAPFPTPMLGLLGAAVGVAALLFLTRGGRAAVLTPAAREALADELADLEFERRTGRVSQSGYEAARTAILKRAPDVVIPEETG